MAQVPEVGGQTVAPTSGGQPLQQINAPAAAFGAPIAEGLAHVAGSVDQASDMLAKRAEVMQGLTNAADSNNAAIASDTAQNKATINFTTNVKGAQATQAAYDAYVNELNTAREAAKNSLSSPMAQKMFDAATRRSQFNFEGEAARHLAREQDKYVTTSATDLMQSKGDLLVADPTNPQVQQDFLDTVKAKSNFLALHQGLDTLGDDIHAQQIAKKVQGQFFTEAAKNLAVNSPTEALQYLKDHQDLMDPKSYTAALVQLQPAVMSHEAASIADAAVASAVGGSHAPAAAANPAAYFGSIVGEGVTITSGARTPEHNAEVGGVPNSEHIPTNGTAFDLVPPKGMSTADLAAKLKAGIPDAHQILDEGDHVHVGWRAVAGASVNSLAGGALTSMQLQGRAQAAIAAADAQAEAAHPGNQAFKDQVEQHAMASLNRQISAAKDVEYAAYSELAAPIVAGGVQDLPTLLAQPGALDKYNSLPIPQRTALQAEMKRNANEITPQRFQTLTMLNGMAKDNPNAFTQQDIASMDLPTTSKLALMKEQATIRNRPGNVDPEAKFLKQVQQTPEWKSTVLALGMKPNTPDYYHLVGALSAEEEAWSAANAGKVPTPKDTMGMLARATAQRTYHNTFLGMQIGGPQKGSLREFDTDDEDVKAATAYLQSQGLPVNDLNIAHLVHGNRIRGGGK